MMLSTKFASSLLNDILRNVVAPVPFVGVAIFFVSSMFLVALKKLIHVIRVINQNYFRCMHIFNKQKSKNEFERPTYCNEGKNAIRNSSSKLPRFDFIVRFASRCG